MNVCQLGFRQQVQERAEHEEESCSGLVFLLQNMEKLNFFHINNGERYLKANNVFTLGEI